MLRLAVLEIGGALKKTPERHSIEKSSGELHA